MLTRLYISNYALISSLEIGFGSGLTIITGETGAGKSIILGALSLILGDRADARGLRHSSGQKTVVEAEFDLTGYDMRGFFDAADIEYFATECIVRREVSPAGRSRAFINDTPVSLAQLRELTSRLIDIHSQHSNALLASRQFQIEVLDSLAANGPLLARYQSSYARYRSIEKQLQQLQDAFSRSRAEEDYLRFQIAQLDELAPHPGEDVELEAMQNKLSNINDTKETLWNVTSALNGDDDSVIDRLSAAAQSLAVAEKHLSDIAGTADRISTTVIELKDIAQTLSSVDSELADDPQRLADVEARLNDIYALERKHNVQGADALIELQRQYREKLDFIDSSDEEIEAVKAQLAKAEAEVASLAGRLTSSRREAADSFIGRLKPLAVSLGMKNLQFNVAFTACPFGPKGADQVEFMFAFNKNQPLMPVKDTASGGEISRLMLCIKSIIAESMNLPTIIFDEVDTGVSGDIANRIGQLMNRIARRIQVMAITHLPQVAAFARHHLLVYKTDTATDTVTAVRTLTAEQHIGEVARMLSGRDVDSAAIENAKSLIRQIKTTDNV